jgi:hypothetical protein
MVQPGFVLGELKSLLDTPAGSGDADQLDQRYGCVAVADVVGQLAGFADRAANQQLVAMANGARLLAHITPRMIRALAKLNRKGIRLHDTMALKSYPQH